MDMQS